MWIAYALGASVMWGLSYSISGWLYSRGLSAIVFYFLSVLLGLLASGTYLLLSSRIGLIASDLRLIKGEWLWLGLSLMAVAIGNLCVCLAIEAKNATMAALIEASYPIFVALLAWLFFNQMHLTWLSIVGGALIIGGVFLVAIAR